LQALRRPSATVPQRAVKDLPLVVRVPASTSNLGPGFDMLGLALSLELQVVLRGRAPGAEHVLARAEGEAARWPHEGERMRAAFDLAARRLELPRGGLVFEARSEIPIGRGIGSSGAATAAGLLLAAALAPRAVARETLVAWGLELEGHPDNSTAALLGGCTLAVPLGDGRVRVVRQPLAPELGFALAWPAVPLETARARAALPATVPFADAVENPRRLALLLEGLRTADPELCALGIEDRLHLRWRLPFVPGGAAALDAAKRAGAWGATLSGAGSGLVALCPRARASEVAAAMVEALERALPGAEGRAVEPVHEPPEVRPLR
jgi:homoserine kinase